MKTLLLVLALSCVCFGQTTHTTASQNGNNLFTGLNTFTLPTTFGDVVINGSCTGTGCASGGGGGYATIKNASVAITQRTILNVLGALVCADNAGTSASDCKLATNAAVTNQYLTGVDSSGNLLRANAVTTFTTTTWPSWLTPTVTNATTTPNLDVSAGIVPEANGGTGANNTAGAAGHYLRSNGTHYVDAAATVMSWGGGPYAGSIPATAGNIPIRSTLPAAATIITYTMHLVTPGAGCTTQPTYQLTDLTTSTVISTITLVNAQSDYSNTGINTAFTSGHDIGIKVGTSAGGCGTAPANGMWTVWYTM